MDNMPPLPEPAFRQVGVEQTTGRRVTISNFYADQMHAYARAYAEKRCAPLVEALKTMVLYFPTDTDMREVGWSDRYVNEACDAEDAALAALAAHKEQSNG